MSYSSPNPAGGEPVQAILVVSFGAPEQAADVLPFLENVSRGRRVPAERLLAVAEHYHQVGGCSPLGAATRLLVSNLERELAANGPQLPVYLGNRNWHPFLADTVGRMAAEGVSRALAFVTSAFGSYSGCRQYLEDIERARAAVGAAAPRVDKLRLFYNHPEFIAIEVDRVREALATLGTPDAPLLFTAHSIPLAMAAAGPYEAQLREAMRAICTAMGRPESRLVFQSRSGDPRQPWLEPDISVGLRELRQQGADSVVLVPLAFLSENMEVVYDLDVEAAELCGQLGLRMARARTPGDHPRFAGVVRELILERTEGRPARAVGRAWPDECPQGCCAAAKPAGV